MQWSFRSTRKSDVGNVCVQWTVVLSAQYNGGLAKFSLKLANQCKNRFNSFM